MKTRIVWTKVWDDEWFDKLSQEARILFLFCLTNQTIGLSGYFELREKTICYYTHLTKQQLTKAKKELFPKARFYESWVYLPKAVNYNGYYGEKNQIALNKELATIPDKVKTTLNSKDLDTLSISYVYPIDTTINHKSNNINNMIYDISDVQREIVDLWNSLYTTKFKPSMELEKNINFWLKRFSLLEIKSAIKNISTLRERETNSTFWKSMRPSLFFRQRNSVGEADYIETALNTPKNTEDLGMNFNNLPITKK